MIGNWRWNASLGSLGFMLTFVFSISKNPISVVLLHSVYAFIALFVIAYAVRAVLAYVLRPPALIGGGQAVEHKGTNLDLRTPDETDDLNAMLITSMIGEVEAAVNNTDQLQIVSEFQPLSPPKLVSVQDSQPEELAKAIRHLTGG